MSLFSDAEIDSILTTVGSGRKVTIDPGGLNEVANLPARFDGPSQREDLATGQVISTRPQIMVRKTAVAGIVVGGHQTGTQILDQKSLILYRAIDVLHDDNYSKILLTKVS